MTKRALITGGSGQDAWYLSERLLSKGYIVHLQTRSERIAERREGVDWKLGDLTDSEFLKELISSLQPDEIYNLAAVSRPSTAWDLPFRTAALNAFVPHQMCEYIQKHSPNTRLFQASSSEIFGARTLLPQNEQTPTDPRGPYGIAKDYAHHIIGAYRSQYGLHLSSGILFNHESPRRPLTFVSQK